MERRKREGDLFQPSSLDGATTRSCESRTSCALSRRLPGGPYCPLQLTAVRKVVSPFGAGPCLVLRANGMHDRHHSTITLHHRNNIGPRFNRRREGECLGPLEASPPPRRGKSKGLLRSHVFPEDIFSTQNCGHAHILIGETIALGGYVEPEGRLVLAHVTYQTRSEPARTIDTWDQTSARRATTSGMCSVMEFSRTIRQVSLVPALVV